MRNILNDAMTFFKFLSFDFIKAAVNDPLTAIGLIILWAAGTLRDFALIGTKNCDE